MSWQRIDENTYIDDTLVTCAEYQLFIDEMCEQGKYYQPDHWTSYQFPIGQAREPILGLRPSDAKVFCEWLAKREGTEWSYRLPFQRESVAYSLKFPARIQIGYWITEYQVQPLFTWISSVPVNPRNLQFFRNRDDDFPTEYTDQLDHSLDHSLYRVLDAVGYNSPFARIFFRTFGLSRPLDLDHTFENSIKTLFNAKEILHRIFKAKRATSNSIEFDEVITDILESALRSYVNLNKESQHIVEMSVTSYILMFLDIYTLRERIAGRSPAFEGIRLVKERIR